MRILFAGSPAIAIPALRALAATGHEIVGVLSNPPSAKGRSGQLEPTPVATEAALLLPATPILTPLRLGSEARALIEPLKPELLAVFAYGRIFGPRFLALFAHGGINVHPSLLPRWRGASPIPAAILARDARTGVSVQRIALELDSGDILAQEAFDLDGAETSGSLSERCAELGASLLVECVDAIAAGRAQGQPQDPSGVSWSREFRKEDGLLDWNASALEIDARIRAFQPWPGAYSFLRGERLALIEAVPYPDEDLGLESGTVGTLDVARGIMVQTGKGLLALRRLQLHAKKAMPYRDFANGVRGLQNSRLGA